jgi:hypothetical protein
MFYIYRPAVSTLTIKSEGTLVATGGGGAAIGSGDCGFHGTVTIDGALDDAFSGDTRTLMPIQ